MKKILCLVLTVLMLLPVFAGCTPAQPAQTTAATTEGFDPAKLTINGVALEEYVIVYAQDGLYSPVRASKSWVESGRMADVAQLFSDALFELTGKRIHVLDDKTSELEHEIIIGKADRKAAKDFYSSTTWKKEKYAYGVYDGKLLIAGGSSNACYFAGQAFIDACKAMTTCDYTAEMVKDNAEFIEVACIGDSITDGVGYIEGGETDRNYYSWPVYLQRLLGYQYYIGNYGFGSKLMTDFAMYNNFQMSLDAKPDVVIMMLGTNDASPKHTGEKWGTEDYKKQYYDAADSMISKYRAANADVQVFMCTPIVTYNEPHAKRAELACEYNKDIAQQMGLEFVDMWTPTKEGNWLFYDGLHPQGEVYGNIADCVYAGIKDTIKK